MQIIYYSYTSIELAVCFSVHRIVRGKDHCPTIDEEQCDSSPRLTQLVTFALRIECIHSAKHAVSNGTNITCFYQRQVFQEAGHWRPSLWTNTRNSNTTLPYQHSSREGQNMDLLPAKKCGGRVKILPRTGLGSCYSVLPQNTYNYKLYTGLNMPMHDITFIIHTNTHKYTHNTYTDQYLPIFAFDDLSWTECSKLHETHSHNRFKTVLQAKKVEI